VSLEFLTLDAPAVARSPMERQARAAGARFEVRDGWNVAVDYGAPEREREICRTAAGWADVSHLAKLELQGDHGLAGVTRRGGAWWCPVSDRRALVLGARGSMPGPDETEPEARVHVVEVTSNFAALTLIGPLAREVVARFCALDLRPQATPVGSLRPGSVARQPGMVLREGEHRFMLLFGWAIGEYMWTVVQDAATHLGGGPVGQSALEGADA